MTIRTKRNKLAIIFALLPVLVFNFSCKNESSSGPESYTYQVPEQTGDGWETASLSDVGMDENLLTDMVNNINNNVYTEVHAVVIIKEGRLVFEVYFPGHVFNYSGENYHGSIAGYNRETTHNTHSATKSITSALVGIAMDQGFIRDVDEKIFTFFTDYTDLNTGGKDTITVEHLLTMTSGLEWNEWDVSVSDANHDIIQFCNSWDPVAYILGKPLVTEPGTTFYYNGGGVDLLGEIVRIASGLGVDDFSEQYLFGPLGITHYNWQRLRSGMICTHGDIYLRPRDMAKFGYLFLENGVWNGTTIISQAWVQKSTEQYIALPQLDWADGYGYLWWLQTYHANNGEFASFRADGWGGQQIIVLPGIDMVVVFTGANYVSNPPCQEILTRFILPAVDAL